MTAEKKKRIAIFASGAGSNAARIIDHFKNHPEAEVAMIVCNNPLAGVIRIAEENHIPGLLISKKEFNETGYAATLQQADISLIVLAGFLWKVPEVLIHHFQGRIVNIHPALLPKYGGKGMYGMNVHAAVINANEKYSGITIHFVDEEYDRGNTILQESIMLREGETAESLADRIHQLEHRYYPAAIEKLVLSNPS